jgi:cytidyltransferase-like protein
VQIWRSLDDVPADLGRTAVVIGNFDGVHLGHQHVVREARSAADTEGLRVVAVTFDPHPMAVLRPEHAPTSITDIETRAELLRDAGVDDVLALPFDRDVASWSPQEFARRVLADVLPCGRRGRRRQLPLRIAGLGRCRHPHGQRGGARLPRDRRSPRRRPTGLVVDLRPHLPGHR